MTIAIAGGVGVGALVMGPAWHEQRGLARWLAAGDPSGRRVRISLHGRPPNCCSRGCSGAAEGRRRGARNAARRVAAAAAAIAKLPATSPRLEAALAAKATADREATARSSERGCRENCRILLVRQVDEAGGEVAAARAELAAVELTRNREFSVATAELAAMKVPASATPFADRVGVAPWALDLVLAALGSMACNGLAVGLISFAGYRSRKQPDPQLHQRAGKSRPRSPLT